MKTATTATRAQVGLGRAVHRVNVHRTATRTVDGVPMVILATTCGAGRRTPLDVHAVSDSREVTCKRCEACMDTQEIPSEAIRTR